jgi:hypothetical protein
LTTPGELAVVGCQELPRGTLVADPELFISFDLLDAMVLALVPRGNEITEDNAKEIFDALRKELSFLFWPTPESSDSLDALYWASIGRDIREGMRRKTGVPPLDLRFGTDERELRALSYCQAMQEPSAEQLIVTVIDADRLRTIVESKTSAPPVSHSSPARPPGDSSQR